MRSIVQAFLNSLNASDRLGPLRLYFPTSGAPLATHELDASIHGGASLERRLKVEISAGCACAPMHFYLFYFFRFVQKMAFDEFQWINNNQIGIFPNWCY